MHIPIYREPEAARAGLAAALEAAATEGKRVALIFGADWCPDSRALDAAFDHRLVEPLVNRSFVVLKVDVGNRDRNLDLMAEYGLQVQRGIPAVAFLEPDGNLVAALADGELSRARGMTPLEIATLFHRRAAR